MPYLFDDYRQCYGKPSDVGAAREFLEARLARGESVVLLAYHVRSRQPERGSAPMAGDEPVGFVQLYPSFSSLALARVMVLNDVFVSPSHGRIGVARRLVNAAASHAASEGAIRLDLATRHDNVRARRLYESLGFAEDAEFAHMSLELGA